MHRVTIGIARWHCHRTQCLPFRRAAFGAHRGDRMLRLHSTRLLHANRGLRHNFSVHYPVMWAFAVTVPSVQSVPESTVNKVALPQRHLSPAEIESAAADPPRTPIIRLLERILSFLDDWFLEPLLTLRRLSHILILFTPVALTAPVAFVGRRVPAEEGERAGTLWWFDFLAAQMERAGPTFIKVKS